jgi:methyltransferase family protein
VISGINVGSVLAHFIKWQLGLAGPEIWTTPAERECLERYASGKRRLAEIGVWHAGTSRGLRAAMAPNGTFYAVDPYQKGRLGVSIPRIVGRRELGRIRNGRVEWIRMSGIDAARSRAIRDVAPFDFVFIDDAQTYEMLKDEWEAWAPLVGSGGIIALHDSRRTPGEPSEQSSVRYACDVVLRDDRFEVQDTVDSLTVLRRR